MNSNIVSVVLATYNERENIALIIESIHRHLEGYNIEIVVVDDNSPDGTYDIASEINLSCLKTIQRTSRRGLASAIRLGLENTNGKLIVVMDADFDHSPVYLPIMLKELADCDCVSASRFISGGKPKGLIRGFFSRIFDLFIKKLIGSNLSDHLFGFFVIRKEALEACNYDKIFWGFGDYYMRLLYYLEKSNTLIKEIPAIHGRRKNGKSKASLIQMFLSYLIEAIKLAAKGRVKKVV